jgi:hypothetical protein
MHFLQKSPLHIFGLLLANMNTKCRQGPRDLCAVLVASSFLLRMSTESVMSTIAYGLYKVALTSVADMGISGISAASVTRPSVSV